MQINDCNYCVAIIPKDLRRGAPADLIKLRNKAVAHMTKLGNEQKLFSRKFLCEAHVYEPSKIVGEPNQQLERFIKDRITRVKMSTSLSEVEAANAAGVNLDAKFRDTAANMFKQTLLVVSRDHLKPLVTAINSAIKENFTPPHVVIEDHPNARPADLQNLLTSASEIPAVELHPDDKGGLKLARAINVQGSIKEKDLLALISKLFQRRGNDEELALAC